MVFKSASIDRVVRPKDQKEFKVGDKVYWNDPDYIYEDQEYQQKYGSLFEGIIEKIEIIQYDWTKKDDYNIEIYLDDESTKPYGLGRLELSEIEHSPEDIEEYFLAGQYLELTENCINNDD